MSSTRRSTTGTFRQERFCSAPEFEGDAINGLAAGKRIAIVKDAHVREALWWIQWLSLKRAGLQPLCDKILAAFPMRVGTPTFRRLLADGGERRALTAKEVAALDRECCDAGAGILSASDILAACGQDGSDQEDREEGILCRRSADLSDFALRIREAAEGLREDLIGFCLDPQADLTAGVWYFDDLLGALIELRSRFIEKAQRKLADTFVTRKINETLDFWYSRRRMVLIEGVAGIGRSETSRTWCDTHAGMVRHVEVPSSSDDRSFFASIARELGVARGASFKSQQIKVRVEEMLATSELGLILDESQYLWGQAMRPRKTPDRLLWIKAAFDAGTPIALVAHTDFTKWQEHFVARTLWTDEQFERRINRRVSLPTEHSKKDMLRIAKAHFPTGDIRSWKNLASYALGTAKKQASGIVEALESARYRAEQDGRKEACFDDIKFVLTHVHGFLSEQDDDSATAEINCASTALQKVCKPREQPLQTARRKARGPRSGVLSATEKDFSTHPRLSVSDRVTLPAET